MRQWQCIVEMVPKPPFSGWGKSAPKFAPRGVVSYSNSVTVYGTWAEPDDTDEGVQIIKHIQEDAYDETCLSRK